MKKTNFYLILASAASFAAGASPVRADAQKTKPKVVDACPTEHSIEEGGAEECDDNAKFASAGKACLQALEADINAQAGVVGQQMNASNAVQTGQNGNSQTHDFSGASADYALSQATLKNLIASANYAHDSVGNYLQGIYYPEDFDAEEEEIGDPLEYLDKNPCYVDNETSLKSTLATIDKHIAELQNALHASNALGNSSTTKGNLQDSLSAPNVANTNGKGSGTPSVKGTSSNSASSITGVQQDEAKQKQPAQ